jgi:acyl-CoA synthetase (AMP-forming)/AMP-acid ligase II
VKLSPFQTSGEALRHQARTRGDAEALAFPLSGGRLSFAGWLDDSSSLARALMELGLGRGQNVALLAENRLEWPVVQLAAALAGLVLVPLNSHLREDDLGYALRQSDSAALLVSRRFRSSDYLAMVAVLRDQLPALRHVICFDGPDANVLAYRALLEQGRQTEIALPDVAASDIATLLYTSGTTGFPKGALLTHQAMLANSWGTSQRLRCAAGDRWTSIIPLFHCAGCVLNLLGSLQSGATYVGVPAFDPVAMFKVIESERCTMLSGVPTSYAAMLDHPERGKFDLSSLRSGTCGGADADPDILRRCAEEFPMPRLAQAYGQTESSTLVTCPEYEDDDRFATAGTALPGYEIRIADPQSGAVLATGSAGQIQARGPMVMRGYYNKPKETAETISDDGWLSTGDLGYLREDGHLVVAGGRLRDMIIRGGENIYPVEIENLLRGHPAVGEIAVFGLPDAYYGETVAAAVRLRAEADAASLAAYCNGRIAKFKIPAQFFRITDFPQTASGKIRKTELRELGKNKQLEPLP